MGRKTVYNELYTPEKWEKVNRENIELLNDFLEYKKSSDKSPKTIEQYYQMIRFFFCWNLEYNNNKFFVDIKKREFIKFFSYAVEKCQWSPNRISTVKSSLSSLSNYIENILDDEFENYRNTICKIETAVKQPVREKTVLEPKEIEACLSKLVENKKYQLACYLALAVASGARKAELLQFKTSYFKDEYIEFGCLYKTPEMIRTKGRGSKGKMLNKYTFVKMFKPYFDLWMKYRKENGIDNEWLFLRKTDSGYDHANIRNANTWCETITKYLGKPFYSHAARHRYVTMMKEANLPNEVIIALVGWTSDMTSVYDDRDITSDLGKYFDENGIRSDIKSGTVMDI